MSASLFGILIWMRPRVSEYAREAGTSREAMSIRPAEPEYPQDTRLAEFSCSTRISKARANEGERYPVVI
jgi:hypothetical protein